MYETKSDIFPSPDSVPVTRITLNKTTITNIKPGNTVVLKATITPNNATDKTITWSSTDSNIVSISRVSSSGDQAHIYLKKAGAANIIAKASNGMTANCVVVVPAVTIPVTKITLDKTSVTNLKQGNSFTITATITPNNATNKTIYWSSTNSNVAEIRKTAGNQALIYLKSSGSAYIIARASNGMTANCVVYVPVTTSPTLKGYEIVGTTHNMKYRQTQQLTLKALYSDGSRQTVNNSSIQWKSSNLSNIYVYSDGVVICLMNTGYEAGYITAYIHDKKVATYKIYHVK